MPAFLADNISKLHQNYAFSSDFSLVDAWIMTLKNESWDLFLHPTSSHFIPTLPGEHGSPGTVSDKYWIKLYIR